MMLQLKISTNTLTEKCQRVLKQGHNNDNWCALFFMEKLRRLCLTCSINGLQIPKTCIKPNVARWRPFLGTHL